MAENFEVRDPEIELLLKDIGLRLKTATEGSGYGFALFIMSFNSPNMFYISNADRETFITTLKEFIQKHRIN